MSLFFVADGVSYRALSKNSTLSKATLEGAPTSLAADMSLMIIGRPGESEPISEAEIDLTADSESPPIARKPEPVYGQTALIMKGGWTLTTGKVKRRINHVLQIETPQVGPQQPRKSPCSVLCSLSLGMRYSKMRERRKPTSTLLVHPIGCPRPDRGSQASSAGAKLSCLT